MGRGVHLSSLSTVRFIPNRVRARKTTSVAAAKQLMIRVPPHPLVKHWIAVARNADTPSSMFRGSLAELGRTLLYEAGKEILPTVQADIMTPMEKSSVEFIDPSKSIKIVPIIRSGLILCEHASSVIPNSETYHVGLQRHYGTREYTMYLNKLPSKLAPDDIIFVVDSLIASGGTLLLVLDEIMSRGATTENITVICAIAAAPGLQKLSEKCPAVRVFAGTIDPELNEHGYIVPGIGDVGDRAFGTTT